MRQLLTIIVFFLLTTSAALAQDAVILPYETALARIEQAAQTEATQLDLSNLGLSKDTLPDEIGQLEHLQELILTGNADTEIGNGIQCVSGSHVFQEPDS